MIQSFFSIFVSPLLTTKIQWALEYGSNIVQPSWITESWENRVLSNPKFHILPPLHGCVISVTGLSTGTLLILFYSNFIFVLIINANSTPILGTRNTIQNLVTHYGGKYMQQLSRKVTHLLCDISFLFRTIACNLV